VSAEREREREREDELTKEVREAFEPLRVAERADLDLHASRRLRTARDTVVGLTSRH
jgi:hypothetical protein